MALFEQIGKQLTSASKEVVQQTKNLSDVARINNLISDNNKTISSLYSQLGEKYYHRHANDSSAEDLEVIKEITFYRQQNAQLLEQVRQIKGVGKCANCGADIDMTAHFCSVCGQPAKIEVKRICSKCGAQATDSDVFCTSCGTKLPAEKMSFESDSQYADLAKTCPHCHTEIVAEDRFCPECGNVLKP